MDVAGGDGQDGESDSMRLAWTGCTAANPTGAQTPIVRAGSQNLLGSVRWGDVAVNSLGVLGAGAGFLVGGALVAAPTGISQVIGGLVLAKSTYAMGTSSYNLGRAFSADQSFDIPSNYQTLPRVIASNMSSSPSAARFADAAELTLDFASGTVERELNVQGSPAALSAR